MRIGVLEGDVAGSFDADRLSALHVPVTQLNTDGGFGGECHLDANMVRSALPSLPLDDIDLLIIENVGNLVCPAEFRVGEDAKAMVCSVTEGEDKPLKYPLMFRTCELVVVNKIDLLPHIDFDLDRFLANVDSVNPGVPHRAGERAHRRGRRGGGRLAGGHGGEGAHRRVTPVAAGRIDALLARRAQAAEAFFGAEAERIARLCHRMAERFAAGGRLVAMGLSAQARSDVRHVTVEFVHPVIVGKRALPALGLSREGGSLPAQVELAVEPGDIAIAFGDEPEVGEALAAAGRRGALTVAFGADAEWAFPVPSDDAMVAQEQVETLYHVLWELVHVFFEHPGLLEGREARRAHDSGASSFLYPFLAESETDLDAVLDDVRGSVLLKSAEAEALREQTLRDGGERAGRARPPRCASASRRAGSCWRWATAARPPTPWTWWPTCASRRAARPGRRALDLTEDPAVITAIANDIGTDAIFQRQVIAHGRAGRRAARAVHQRELAQRDRGAGRGPAARPGDDRDGGLRRRPGGRASGWPTTWWSRARSTSRASRRRRPRPTTRWSTLLEEDA